jgi:hypothetical protein
MPLSEGLVPFLEFCLRQVLPVLSGYDPADLLIGVDQGWVHSSLVHRFEHVLIEDFVDDRARLVGTRIEEDRIIGAGRSAELLGEPLRLVPNTRRQFWTQRNALVAGSLWWLLRLVPLSSCPSVSLRGFRVNCELI